MLKYVLIASTGLFRQMFTLRKGSLGWPRSSDSASNVYLVRDIDCGRVAWVDQVGQNLRQMFTLSETLIAEG
jgi:hypothetical protein